MNNHQIIVLIIPKLTSLEVKQIEKLLIKSDFKSKKLKDYFELVQKKKVYDPGQLVLKLYNENNVSNLDAFRKLSDRLLDKLFSSFSENSNFLNEKDKYSDIFLNRQYVSKQISLFSFLIIKGLPYGWLKKFLIKNIEICLLYEFIEYEIIIRRQLLHIYIIEKNREKVKECISEIELKTSFLNYIIKSEYYVFEYIDKVQHKSIDDRSLIDGIRNAVREVNGFYINSKLKFILYQKLMLQLQLAHYEENYAYAEEVIFELIKVTESNPSVRFLSRISVNYMNLAYTQFFLHKFEEAYENSKTAAKVFINHINDLNIYREASVFALIYLKRYKEAEEVLEQILHSGSLGNSPEQLSKRHIMMAVIKYLLLDYKQAFKHLQQTKEVETDREGWNLGIRIMNIYLTLSTEKVDLADQRIGSMRKHIERTAKMRNLRKRDVVIFRILSKLSRCGFDFKEVWEERQKDFMLLRSDHSDYRWVPRSHELIIFDQWFECKMKGIPYVPVFPTPAEKTAVDKNSEEKAVSSG